MTAHFEISDWRRPSKYPDHGWNTGSWAWEFLRRNPRYQEQWLELLAVAESLREQFSKQEYALPGETDGHISGLHWVQIILHRAQAACEFRSNHWDQPCLPGEQFEDWMKRTGGSKATPLQIYLGKQWGITSLCDPMLERMPPYSRWVHTARTVKEPSPWRGNRDTSWYARVVQLRADIRACTDAECARRVADELLEKLEADLKSSIHNMFASPSGADRRMRLIEFDLALPLDEQFDLAKSTLAAYQRMRKSSGGRILASRKEVSKYKNYLVALDAWYSKQWTDKAECCREVVLALGIGNLEGAEKRVRPWIDTAIALSESGYLDVAASTPTKARASRKK